MQAESTNQAVAGGTDSRRAIDALRIGKATGFTWCILVVFLAVLSYLQAFVANMVSAALRLMSLGQSDGIAVLATLSEGLPQLAAMLETVTYDDIGSAALAVDLCSARHETQYTRLFRS